jgi:hypothetical protein
LAQCKKYRQQNKEKKRVQDKAYYEANKEKISERSKSPAGRAIQKRFRHNNKQVLVERHRQWRENRRNYLRDYKKRRRTEHPHLVLINRVRCRTWWALRNAKARKNNRTLEFLGCTTQELAKWIESQFTEGMCWEKLGKIHIDHVMPLAAFDLSDPKQQRAAFHYKNLRPMWELDNKRKSSKIPSEAKSVFACVAKIAKCNRVNKNGGVKKSGGRNGNN